MNRVLSSPKLMLCLILWLMCTIILDTHILNVLISFFGTPVTFKYVYSIVLYQRLLILRWEKTGEYSLMSLVHKLKKLSCQEAFWLGELVSTFYAIFVEVQTLSFVVTRSHVMIDWLTATMLMNVYGATGGSCSAWKSIQYCII